MGRRSFLKAAAGAATVPFLARGARAAPAVHHLEIESTAEAKAYFEFTATGEIAPDEDVGYSATEDHDSITENDDGTWTAAGYVMDGGRDAFTYEGDLDALDADDGLRVRVDGVSVSPDAFGDGGPDVPAPADILGGGEGYPDTVPESEADAVVSSYKELTRALGSASSGDVVYVAGDATIDVGSSTLTVPSGVTLASDRGIDGAEGGHITSPSLDQWPGIVTLESDARATGLRISGPFQEYAKYSKPITSGFVVGGKGVEVDNVEAWGFNHSAVRSDHDAHVHHCHIHDNPMDGLGYGVLVKGGHPLVEYCTFDKNRHSIASDGTGGYTVRYNHFGSTTYGHVIDCHRPGGTRMIIHHNTVEATRVETENKPASNVTIRGTPDDVARVENNWFFNPRTPRDSPNGWTPEAIRQVFVDSWTNVTWDGNHYGEDEPDADVGCPR